MLITSTYVLNDSDSRESFGLITKQQYEDIETAILKAIADKWCKGESFRVCDIAGKDWTGTPYQSLADVIWKSNKYKDPHAKTATDFGYFVKRVICNSDYPFMVKKVQMRHFAVSHYVPINPNPIPSGNVVVKPITNP